MPKQRTLQWPALCHKKLTRTSKSFTTKPFHSISYIYIRFEAAQRLALPAWGGRVDSPSKRESVKARKSPKNAARTPSRVHALLGSAHWCSVVRLKES